MSSDYLPFLDDDEDEQVDADEDYFYDYPRKFIFSQSFLYFVLIFAAQEMRSHLPQCQLVVSVGMLSSWNVAHPADIDLFLLAHLSSADRVTTLSVVRP